MCLVLVSVRQRASQPNEKSIRSFYARLDGAISSGNAAEEISMMSPDYVKVPVDGKREVRNDQVKGLRHFFQVSKVLSAHHKLLAVKINGTLAVVEVSGVVESMYEMPSKPVHVRTEFAGTNKLKWIQGAWMLSYVEEHKHRQFDDGKLVSN